MPQQIFGAMHCVTSLLQPRRNVLFDQSIKVRLQASSAGSFLMWPWKTKLQLVKSF